LTKIENLHSLTLLEELYLSENGFTGIEGLDRNVEISTLDLANNKIRAIGNLQHLGKLEELWVRMPVVGICCCESTSCSN
jgi:protein phosphatase 1 regulatory subunit 7